jgi:predicted restriction endonuclease
MPKVILDSSFLPFPKFANDDPHNGLALCKTHHWLLDKGILALDDLTAA